MQFREHHRQKPARAFEHRSGWNCGGDFHERVSAAWSGGRGRKHNSPLPHCRAGRGTARASAARVGDAMARSRDCFRSVPRYPAGEAPVPRRLLGDGLRLAKDRSEDESTSTVHHQHRRHRHPLHSCPLQTSQCPACRHNPWLAGIGSRTAQADRSTHRSNGPCGPARRRVRCRDPFDARLWLLRQTGRYRLGS
jgi:hypothetical protein